MPVKPITVLESLFFLPIYFPPLRCDLCGEDLFSSAALERHTVLAHSNKKRKL